MPGELIWLAVSLLSSVGLVVALGTSSTARYEFERNGVQAQRQRAAAAAPAAATAAQVPADGSGAAQAAPLPAPTAVRTHPSARLATVAPMATGWWLVDGPGAPLAGPFADAVDADWAAFALGLPESARTVYGTQREDGGVARRQSPQERVWLDELGRQLDRLPEEWTELISDDDALTTLAVDVTAALLEAGLPLHDCDGHTGEARGTGGACLAPRPEAGGLVVTWRQHDRMSVQQMRGADAGNAVQHAMTEAVITVLEELGFAVEPYGPAGGHLVTASGR
ncbi:hypothetical protein [Blastococcus sp. LR1]|uniref:hypothetical protein n=1 Tax=Blastococcus sp. LR1 TaxID=2877000 RepID=UPI001CCEB443|nr:hypothetical protein [Blastococcus sp. LR1]MCA0145900.1 hypothetical protein [Blastococcus sp. LR1]